ncbi:MAG: SafA/ExsA family spore coat assembly protein [Oscillospiraceae bacterium]|jgi:uncharacterized YkwD family protein/spore coat assembly protein SafA|nr:SafA/ExsA family spore coat assembly protein [Oscillospiraceae bacterium]
MKNTVKFKSKVIVVLALMFSLLAGGSYSVYAQDSTYTVQKGDSLWKIAVKYEIGLSELIETNKQFTNPALIYPGDKVYIPNIDDIKSLEAEVIRLTNIERANNGLSALKTNWELSRVSRYKSDDMLKKNYFAHQSPTYGSPFDMMKSFGITYSAAAENIAMGQRTPKEVVNAWMNSAGHRANILSNKYDQIGVGAAKSANGTLYWTQQFIKAR